MNSNENLLSKKTTISEIILYIDPLNIFIGWIISKFFDLLLLIPRKLINSMRDLYQWKKETIICQYLDKCEKCGCYEYCERCEYD